MIVPTRGNDHHSVTYLALTYGE